MTEKHVLIECKHEILGNQTFEVLQPLSKLSRQSLKVFEFVEMFSINKYGRNFKPGIPLSKDFRNEVIQMAATRPISEICERYRINRSTVHKYTKQYRETGNIDPLSRKHIRTRSKLSFGDSMLLETIVQSKGSTSLKEIKAELTNFGDCGELSLSTLSRHVRKNLPSGKDYSRKRLGKCASERFTHENLVYTQLFLDYLSNKDPSSVKFFDETGFQLPDSGHRVYGYSPVGEQCFDVRRYLSTANITLNFLAGVDGLKYANIVQGASNSIEFLRFFSEASQTVDPNTLRPVLEVGDIVVVDNFAAHHGDAEVALRSFLNDVGMELLYLPAYSPDLNPDEEVFSKLKYLLKYQYQDIVFENLEYAVWCAVGDLEAADMYGYYRHAGYLI